MSFVAGLRVVVAGDGAVECAVTVPGPTDHEASNFLWTAGVPRRILVLPWAGSRRVEGELMRGCGKGDGNDAITIGRSSDFGSLRWRAM